MTRLKLKQLRLLDAVTRYGSIQGAARELHISQPAATKMIRDLELDFEVKLFERTNRGVIPTECGDTLIRHGKLILAQVSNVAQELDDLTEGSIGRVVVGTLLAATPDLLPSAIEVLMRERPKVAIKIIEGTNSVLTPALMSGELDMIVGRLPTYRLAAGLVQEQLFEEKILAVTGKHNPLARRRKLSFEQLRDHGWILPPPETALRSQIDQYFNSQDSYAPPAVLESVAYLTNRALLSKGNLIGLFPEHVFASDILHGDLAALDWEVPFGKGPVGITHRGLDFLSPAASAFVHALRRVTSNTRDTIDGDAAKLRSIAR